MSMEDTTKYLIPLTLGSTIQVAEWCKRQVNVQSVSYRSISVIYSLMVWGFFYCCYFCLFVVFMGGGWKVVFVGVVIICRVGVFLVGFFWGCVFLILCVCLL